MSLVIKTVSNPVDAAEMFNVFGNDFTLGAAAAHDTWVMRILEYIVRFSRVDTGRSRAGWFNFMDLHGYDYHRSLPAGGHDESTEQGRAMGQSIASPFHTTIINNVKYVDPMNRRYGLFGFSGVAVNRGNVMSEKVGRGRRGMHRLFGVSEHGNRMTRGLSLEDKIPQFEQYGAENYQKFVNQAKASFEGGGRKFKPDPIPPVVNDPPTTM